MSYALVRHDTPSAFLGRAEEWLLQREDLHNLILGLAYARARSGNVEPDALFGTVEWSGRIVGCLMRTPPHKLLLTDMPVRACTEVASRVADMYDEIPAVLGPVPMVEVIAERWVANKGGAWEAGARQRIYRLDAVTMPSGVAGGLRGATADDAAVATEWAVGFGEETNIQFGSPAESVATWIENRSLFIWDDDGPVSIAVAHGKTPTGIRVGYVFTPPERRGRGYASACVAQVSQRMLDSGLSFCVLYTDLENPTSNALYQRLGYYPLADVRDYDILPPEESA